MFFFSCRRGFANRVTKENQHNQNGQKKATENPYKGTEPHNNEL